MKGVDNFTLEEKQEVLGSPKKVSLPPKNSTSPLINHQ